MAALLAKLAPYRKVAVALVGAAVTIVGRQFGADSAAYLDVVAVATALGVFALPNE